LKAIEARFDAAHAEESRELGAWVEARKSGDPAAESAALAAAFAALKRVDVARGEAKKALQASDTKSAAGDADYVFISFILGYLPHGLIGLLVAAFFAAALSSKAGELNALGSTTTVDIYRHLVRSASSDAHYVAASKLFTAFWGVVAILFALFATLTENLIQAVNIVGSLFYGVVLGIFLVAFYFRKVGGTAVFWAAIASQLLVIVLYRSLSISYLWYNVIGCAACIALAALLQAILGPPRLREASKTP
jgi:Na+/proline symporter